MITYMYRAYLANISNGNNIKFPIICVRRAALGLIDLAAAPFVYKMYFIEINLLNRVLMNGFNEVNEQTAADMVKYYSTRKIVPS